MYLVAQRVSYIHTCTHRRLLQVPGFPVAVDLSLAHSLEVGVADILVHGAAEVLDGQSAAVADVW
jgi:hypothetical protein